VIVLACAVLDLQGEPEHGGIGLGGKLTFARVAAGLAIARILAPLGLRVDESSPWVDARLSDGSRVQTNFS